MANSTSSKVAKYRLCVASLRASFHTRFNLSHRDIEDLLAERGIIVSHGSIRLWCIKFGA